MNNPQAIAEFWSGIAGTVVMGLLALAVLVAVVVTGVILYRREEARHEVRCPECDTTIRARMADR